MWNTDWNVGREIGSEKIVGIYLRFSKRQPLHRCDFYSRRAVSPAYAKRSSSAADDEVRFCSVD